MKFGTARFPWFINRLKPALRYDLKSRNATSFDKSLDRGEHCDRFVCCELRDSTYKGDNRTPKRSKYWELQWHSNIPSIQSDYRLRRFRLLFLRYISSCDCEHWKTTCVILHPFNIGIWTWKQRWKLRWNPTVTKNSQNLVHGTNRRTS